MDLFFKRVPLFFLFVLLSLFLLQSKGDLLGCDELTNLGHGFSEATGPNVYSSPCYPPITSFSLPLPGRDDSVAVFVGGDFHAVLGAEVEGIVVVLGTLQVDNGGPGNFVSVGSGTQVLPNSGGDCIIVGEDLIAFRAIQVFNLAPTMSCNIVYRGNAVNEGRWETFGTVRNEPGYDLSEYFQIKDVLNQKSQFWKTLPANAVVSESFSTTTFACDATDDIQVFNINKGTTPKNTIFADILLAQF